MCMCVCVWGWRGGGGHNCAAEGAAFMVYHSPFPPPQLHASCLPSFRPRRVVYFVGVGGREDGGGLILKVFLALKTNTEIFEKHYTGDQRLFCRSIVF